MRQKDISEGCRDVQKIDAQKTRKQEIHRQKNKEIEKLKIEGWENCLAYDRKPKRSNRKSGGLEDKQKKLDQLVEGRK